MVIKASTGAQVAALIADLGASQVVVRDAAIARLAVLGTRAVERLLGAARDTDASAGSRAAALRALEAIGDPRGAAAALPLLDDREAEVAEAAVAIARLALGGPGDAAALDRLTATALDGRISASVREAAVRALSSLGPGTLKPILKALSTDDVFELRELATRLGSRPRGASDGGRTLHAAAMGSLPDDPHDLTTVIETAASRASLEDLRQMIDVLRARETSAHADERHGWIAARGAVHAALARRGSRLGLFDLRDTIVSAATPLPVAFAAALVDVGDASCLEAIAAAYARAAADRGSSDDWWHRHLADAFRAIVMREQITRRHGVLRRIEARWPAAFTALWAARSG